MNIKLTDGKIEKINLKKYQRRDSSKSDFQHKIGKLLAVLYPMDIILEEVYIPGEKLFLDFFIPSLKLVIECDGQQHDKFISFFHKTLRRFHQQQDRDHRKRMLCEINGIHFVSINAGMRIAEILSLLRGDYVNRQSE